jgi:hypothetical protein
MSKKIEFIGNADEDPDNVLRQAIGELESVVVLGYDKNGGFFSTASKNIEMQEINMLADMLKDVIIKYIMNDDD